jgi:hypothetical protein
MRKSVESVGNFFWRLSGEEEFLSAVEVNAHEIHLQQIADILLGRSLSVEEVWLVMGVNSLRLDFVNLDSEGIAF